MIAYYITVVVQWLASVLRRCKVDGSNPVSVISCNCQTINMKEFTRDKRNNR